MFRISIIDQWAVLTAAIAFLATAVAIALTPRRLYLPIMSASCLLGALVCGALWARGAYRTDQFSIALRWNNRSERHKSYLELRLRSMRDSLSVSAMDDRTPHVEPNPWPPWFSINALWHSSKSPTTTSHGYMGFGISSRTQDLAPPFFMRSRSAMFPKWFGVMVLTGVSYLTWKAHRRKMSKLRLSQGLCTNCNFDLRAHAVGAKCPECGTPKPELPVKSTSTPTTDAPNGANSA